MADSTQEPDPAELPVPDAAVDPVVVPAESPQRAPGRRAVWRRRVRWLAGTAVALIVLAAVPTVWERLVAGSRLRDQGSVPAEPVAVVFGAKVSGGQPSPFLAGRLDIAVRLYVTGRVRAVLVSGDNSTADYDEPDVMRGYLIAHGVPAGQVVADYAGFDTWDTCARTRRIFGVDHAILVTQTFHVPRAVAVCRANGIDAYGVGDDSGSTGAVKTAQGYAREVLAAPKAMWEALISTPDPHFLGRPETGVADALAR